MAYVCGKMPDVMDVPQLLAELARPEAFPVGDVLAVEVFQTHISLVFVAGDVAYKVKKPVRMAFLDYGELGRRREFCEREVALNRRLAAEVYLGVVPIVRTSSGLRFEGTGAAVEWAVKMRRLPAEATLAALLARGEATDAMLRELGEYIAAFHQAAVTSDEIAAAASFACVAGNVRDNLAAARTAVGQTIEAEVCERLCARTEEALATHRELITARARRGVIRDTHGDLRMDHVYRLPSPAGPRWTIVDCIEFNDAFRYADPVADVAFLVMDLRANGYARAARRLTDAYFAATGDATGRALLPLYTSYRAAVRAKVDSITASEPEVPPATRARALEHGRGRWLLALAELEEPQRRPCLVLVGGLPGTGKSTLARQLAAARNLEVIRSDEVRKELAGLATTDSAAAEVGSGIYTAEWTERTYAECLARAEGRLRAGGRVVVDATFARESHRQMFLQAAAKLCVRACWLMCELPRDVVRARITARRGDASDANWSVFEHAERTWEPASATTAAVQRTISTSNAVAAAQEAVSIVEESDQA